MIFADVFRIISEKSEFHAIYQIFPADETITDGMIRFFKITGKSTELSEYWVRAENGGLLFSPNTPDSLKRDILALL